MNNDRLINRLGELPAYFAELEAQERFSGVVVITQDATELYAGAYGLASRAWRIPPTLATRFDTASITKLFTAAAIFQLIDRKQLALDTRVIELLELEQTGLSREITVFHLLTHSSGIGDDADEEAGERYEDLWRDKPNYSVTTTADILPQFIHKPANFAPGQGCRYCNVGYVLLGLAIERLSGMAYREFVAEHIFDRAGMSRSAFLHQGEVNEQTAEGSDPIRDAAGKITGWKKNIYDYPPIGSPDGGAYSTAGDLERFMRALRQRELLSPGSSEAFFTPQVHYRQHDSGSERYGFGMWFAFNAAGQVVFCQKEGMNAGASGLARYYPAEDVCVVMLSNMEAGVWRPMRTVHGIIRPE